VVPDFVGHGIGREFHTPPFIFHFQNDDKGFMSEGMTFTIEPILTEGSPEYVLWPDKWTVASARGDWAAQFESTVLITSNGAEDLTV